MAPTPTPDDFLSGGNRRKEFSRDIGQDWNIRQVDEDLVGTYKPTGIDYPLAFGNADSHPAAWPDKFFTGGLSNGSSTSFVEFITQNTVLTAAQAPPYSYTMFVEATIALGGNGAANLTAFQVRDQAGANINYKGVFLDVLTHWYVYQNFTGNSSRIVTHVVGKQNYAAGAACGFRLAYEVSTSNLFCDVGVRVSFIPL